MTYKKSWQRPLSVTQEHFDSEYDRIFKKPKKAAQKLVNPAPNARYDDVYEDGVRWVDELAGDGDTFEEKVSLSDEMQLHGEKHKPEVNNES